MVDFFKDVKNKKIEEQVVNEKIQELTESISRRSENIQKMLDNGPGKFIKRKILEAAL